MNKEQSEVRDSLLSKVPEITLFFWVIKVLCTTVGETAADFLNVNLNFGLTLTSIITGLLLLIALFFQLRTRQYIPSVYWIAVVLISVFGTLVTDNLTDSMGVHLKRARYSSVSLWERPFSSGIEKKKHFQFIQSLRDVENYSIGLRFSLPLRSALRQETLWQRA